MDISLYKKRERAVSALVAERWRSGWFSTGEYCPIDVYFERNQQIWSCGEIRTRNVRFIDQRYVYIDCDKWQHMMVYELSTRMPTFYIVAYTDAVVSLRIGKMDFSTCRQSIRGRTDRPGKPNDTCPVFDVPANQFTVLCEPTGVFEQPCLT